MPARISVRRTLKLKDLYLKDTKTFTAYMDQFYHHQNSGGC